MLRQETIKLNTSRKGTVGKFFTNYTGQTSPDGIVSYLICNNADQPVNIVDAQIETFYERNLDNNFIPTNGNTIYSGSTIITQFESLSNGEKLRLQQNYINDIIKEFTLQNPSSTILPKSYVEFNDNLIDDMYVNILLPRTIDTLDTLNIYNTPINENPLQESKTGVLIGKLMARQKIKDHNGNPINIPLRNTPVAIFLPTEEFPDITSVDENGNRITLNIKENVNINSYFNKESLNKDLKYLTDTSNFKKIPAKYKYTAITNDNGEFTIFDVPVGEQVLMYEVDLLKQGLTSDEVALNINSYPVTSEPVVDEIPHFFFRQINVNIVPSWGDFQTGYTRVDLTVNIDLRKWITYYISPASYEKRRIEEQFIRGDSAPLIVQVRDMTKKNFDIQRIEVVKIDNLIDKIEDQILEWENENKYPGSKASFVTTDYHVVKLPANMFDPLGTNSKGQPFGIWLGGYQLKMFYKDQNIYRVTGFENKWNSSTAVPSSHFDLNKGRTDLNTIDRLGFQPYDQPWTIYYPEPYKIPSLPSVINPNKQYDQGGRTTSQTEPKFLDGDVAGSDPENTPNGLLAFGYGTNLQKGRYVENIFARRVTQNKVYKYESDIRWDEVYSNGYNQYMSACTFSRVVNGEKYQRLEAGFGYWLKPEGWPRITNNLWGDVISGFDVKEKDGTLQELIPEDVKVNGIAPHSYADSNYKVQLNNNITIRLDNANSIKQGALDIYRVIKPEQVLPPEYLASETFCDLDFVRIYRQDRISTFVNNTDGSIFYDGFNPPPNYQYPILSWRGIGSSLGYSEGVVGSPQTGWHRFGFNQYGWPIAGEGEGGLYGNPFEEVVYTIKNTGSREVQFNINNESYTIGVNENVVLYDIHENDWKLKLRLPGNDLLRGAINKYTKASYEISIKVKIPMNWMNPTLFNPTGLPYVYDKKIIIDLDADSIDRVPQYYLRSKLNTVVVPYLNVRSHIEYRSYNQIYIAGLAFADPVDGAGNSGPLENFLTDSFFDRNRIISVDPNNFNNIPYIPAY